MPRKRLAIPIEIEKYIRINITEKSITDIGKDLGLHKSVVLNMIKYLNITERYRMPVKQSKSKHQAKPLEESKPSFIRPPATYDNMSREDYVEHWLTFEPKLKQ